MKLFDGYMAVDWSANGKPKQGKDSIWIVSRGEGGTEIPENPATRRAAVGRIEELLENATAAGWRLLVGFDFPFGYPKGTARLMTGRAGWEAVWSRIAEVLEDDSRNKNNRFDAAALLNAAFVVDGPFWGNGLSRDISGLPREKPASGWGVNLPANLRHAESEVKKAQEVWKLNGVGSVGGQALTGIAALEGLRNRVDAQVWPFETLGEGRSHVLAEIYPSLIEPNPGPEVKDARQVDAVAAALQQLDKLGELKQHLRAPSHMPAAVCKEEGLILGMQDPAGFQRAARMAAGARRSSAAARGSEVSTRVPQGDSSTFPGGQVDPSQVALVKTNQNGLRLIRKTTQQSSSHHLARIWIVECTKCGVGPFRINGCDFHIRRCPRCDGGAPPEP